MIAQEPYITYDFSWLKPIVMKYISFSFVLFPYTSN